MKLNNKTRLGKLRNLSITASVVVTSFLAIGNGRAATVIYSQDFSSAPTIRVTNNGNTNYFGTGDAVSINHLNQNEWQHRSGNGSITHDGVSENLDITINNNIYTLIDLSSATADGTEYTLSFDVSGLVGTVDVMLFAGDGLDYNGTTNPNGRGFFRTYSNPPSIIVAQGDASLTTIFAGGTSPTVTANGTWTSSTFTLNDIGTFGDYVFLGFENGGSSMTIDNLKITSVIPEPSSSVLLLGALAGLVLRRRRH